VWGIFPLLENYSRTENIRAVMDLWLYLLQSPRDIDRNKRAARDKHVAGKQLSRYDIRGRKKKIYVFRVIAGLKTSRSNSARGKISIFVSFPGFFRVKFVFALFLDGFSFFRLNVVQRARTRSDA